MTRDSATTVDLGCVTRRLAATIQPLHRNTDLTEKLTQLGSAALGSVPGVDAWAIALVDGEKVTLGAASGPPAYDVHDAQVALGEGPAWATTRGGETYVCAEDIRATGTGAGPDSFREAAGRLGVRSLAAVRMRPHRRVLGAVTALSTTRATLPLDAATLDVVGGLAAIAVSEANLREGIEEGLRGRTVIGTAVGIAMERYRLDEEAALHYLKRLSSTTNRKMRDVAAALIAGEPLEAPGDS